MTIRRVRFQPTAKIVSCPRCGNNTDFTIHSHQFSEDCCEIWAECQCGHQPQPSERLEDVWGGTDDANVQAAIANWNDAMTATPPKPVAENPTTTPNQRR